MEVNMPDLIPVTVKIPTKMKAEIQRLMRSQNKLQSAIFRDALAAYIEEHSGVIVDAYVERGGLRPGGFGRNWDSND
jgi:predicted transcriptional regulator